MKAIRFCWLLTLLVAVSAHAETYTTNYVSGVTSNADTVVVGDTGPFNYLEINTAGVLSNTTSTVGNQSGADDNSVLVTGPGSRWDNAGTLTIGSAGNYNQLTVSNEAIVTSAYGALGTGGGAGNSVLLTGSNTAWQITGFGWQVTNLTVEGGSLITVTNGARLDSGSGLVRISGENTHIRVTGQGSLWNAPANLVCPDGGKIYIEDGGQIWGASPQPVAPGLQVEVTGSNSTWGPGSLIFAGQNARLRVANGGSVYSGDTYLDTEAEVSGSNSLWSVGNEFRVGYAQRGRLLVSNGARVGSGWSYIGFPGVADNSEVWVTGSNSVWDTSVLFLGQSSSGNRLMIDGGGAVNSWDAEVVGHSGTVDISGAGSRWNINGQLAVGCVGGPNWVIVRDGGYLASGKGVIGCSDPGNPGGGGTVQIQGSNSVWNISGELSVAGLNFPDGLSIEGGTVTCGSGVVNGWISGWPGQAVVRVSDGASSWIVNGNLVLGDAGLGYQVDVYGSVLASNVIAGAFIGGTITVAGRLIVTNALGQGTLELRRGKLVFNDGAVTTDALVLRKDDPYMDTLVEFWSGGTLSTRSTDVNTTLPFVIGNGFSPAQMRLLGGTHTFNDGLWINTNATLSGCGTIQGVVVNAGGVIATNCPGGGLLANASLASSSSGSLVFMGPVTNNGVIVATEGIVLDYIGPVVNNGTIDATGGSVRFHAGIVNNGTVLLDTDGDADMDGLPNAWEQTYKLDPLIATGGNGPDGEVDGDGFSNLQEYLAGTDPTNSLSALRVTTITPTANDLHVSWTCVGGKNYVLQTNAVMIGSGFTDFSPVISVPGSGESTTNYTHAGAATLPRLFYRVRLEP